MDTLRRLTCAVLLVALWTLSSPAQQPGGPIVRFSTLTGTFDILPPIGRRFDITGHADTDVLAVQVESFGFQGEIPAAFLQEDIVELSRALTAAREKRADDVAYATSTWDRTSENAESTVFRVTHRRLYYGRKYVFFFHYFRKYDIAQQKERSRETFRSVLVAKSDPASLYTDGLTANEFHRAVDLAFRNQSDLVLRDLNTGRVSNMSDLIGNEELDAAFAAIKENADNAHKLPKYTMALSNVNSQVSWLQEQSRKAEFAAVADEIGIVAQKIRLALSAPGPVAAKPHWAEAASLITAEWTDALDIAPTVQLTKTLSLLASAAVGPPATTLDGVVDLAVDRIEFREIDGLVFSSMVDPQFETMDEAYPFIMSLDGGLMWVSDFEELIPVVGVNLKLNPVDFDDMLNRKTEFSLIVGLGMSAPDDLDPDYRGMFDSTGSRSLVIGLGIRAPRISSLLRFQVGAVIYKQADRNPLVDDEHTKASLYFGISANWDAIDHASNLFGKDSGGNRRAFNLGL